MKFRGFGLQFLLHNGPILIIQMIHILDFVGKMNIVKNYVNRIQNDIYSILFYILINEYDIHIYILLF